MFISERDTTDKIEGAVGGVEPSMTVVDVLERTRHSSDDEHAPTNAARSPAKKTDK